MIISEAREKVIKAGIKLVEAGLISRTWGNVSCRVNENSYVITPSGMDYHDLTIEDIVLVNISNEKYTGKVKPSSEKGIHTEVYKKFKDITFIIHTHQLNASVASALDISEIEILPENPILGEKIISGEYGISSTRKLRNNIAAALNKTNGKAVIMKNHGALCFGVDDEDAFKVAFELEMETNRFLESKYLELSGTEIFRNNEMIEFAFSIYRRKKTKIRNVQRSRVKFSQRSEKGILFFDYDDDIISTKQKEYDELLVLEELAHENIYMANPRVNYIIHSNNEFTKAVANLDMEIRPLIDDFAQIVGVKVHTGTLGRFKVKRSIKNVSAIMIKERGALCFGENYSDAQAVSIILEKNCKAFTFACLFGNPKFIGRFDSQIMRYIYTNRYSKLKKGGLL